MSAVVIQAETDTHFPLREEVPKANHYSIDDKGWLHLKTCSWGEQVGVFKQWDRVVITQDRGPGGRFVKKDA